VLVLAAIINAGWCCCGWHSVPLHLPDLGQKQQYGEGMSTTSVPPTARTRDVPNAATSRPAMAVPTGVRRRQDDGARPQDRSG
jgi:hypothetical protein